MPDPQVRIDCNALAGGGAGGYAADASSFFNTGNLSHELKFGAGYRQAEVADLDPWAIGAGRKEIFTEEEYKTALEQPSLELGGPIVRDRLWIWGTYQMPEERDEREDLATDAFGDPPPPDPGMAVAGAPADAGPSDRYLQDTLTLGNLTLNLGLRYDDEPVPDATIFNLSEVATRALVPGVQDGGAEIRIETGGGAPAANGNAPGGAAADDDVPELLLVARGGSTGEVFDATLVAPDGTPVSLEGLVAIEPVAMAPDDRARLERRLARSGGHVAKATVSAYCLQFLAGTPTAGTVFRVAGAAKQAAFAPAARALDAARRLKDAGRLASDTNPEAYFHSIRQWSVWTLEQRFDRAGFLAAFEEHARKSLASTGREWTEPIAGAVRASAEGRWADVSAVLAEAEAGAEAGAEGR